MKNSYKKFHIILTACLILATTCGCTNPLGILTKTKINDVELIEVQNPDYTFTYKTSDGKIIFSNIGQLIFTERIATIAKDGKYGIVNKSGEYIVEPIYDYIAEFHDGMCAFFIQDISNGVKIGYFNNKGEIAIEAIPADLQLDSGYSYDYNFHNGLAMYRQPQTYKYGFIDKSGNYVIPSQFGSFEGHDGEEVANPFIDGYAAVYLGEGQAYRSDVYKGQFALIDKTGKILNGQKYDSLNLTYFEPGKPSYEARLGNKFLTLDTKGNVLKEESY